MFPWFNMETSDAVKNEAPLTDTPTTDDITDIENWYVQNKVLVYTHIDVLMLCRKFEPIPSSNF